MCKVENGRYAGTQIDGPEYETLYAFGSLCGNDNLESIVKANELCDRLGLDTISAGNTVAFAMECYKKGLITRKETEGLALTYGNHEAIITFLEKIAYRDGFGDILAEGVRKTAKKIGKNSEKLAVHVKGLEPPGYDPRGLKGVALAYAVSSRGACHLRHMTYRPNLTGSLPFTEGRVDRLSYEGQARMVKEQEDFYTIVDSMVLCKFVCLPTIGPILWKELEKLYQIITGITVGKKDLVETASRIANVVTAFNEREGVVEKDNALPNRFMSESLKAGASSGEVVRTDNFQKMLNEYYTLRNQSKLCH